MTEHLKQKLNDSAVLRWSVLALVAFTMLCGYFLTDVMSPLKPMLEKELLWDSLDYGFFTSAYGWFNVFLLMLIFSRSADAMRVLNLISFFIISDLSEMISLVPSESWGFLKGGLVPL